MRKSENPDNLRSIPPIDEILRSESISVLRDEYPSFPWTTFLRGVVDDVRTALRSKSKRLSREEVFRLVEGSARVMFDELKDGGMRKVINGTGVILHTNLGRAILGDDVIEAMAEASGNYVTLEYDLARGERGPRAETLLRLLVTASGAEAAMVVNNNAAAVHLVVDTFSPPGRVIVSRGELVEIGGSFRLPAILAKAAEEVVEVGTTNRTYIKDYEEAAKKGDILLKVHRSNYEIEGFAHEASLEEIVSLAAKKGCLAVYDLGSGALFDFASRGLPGEKTLEKVLASGADCVCMSGDKLLGGVQAGIILGKRAVVDELRKNPLRRAFRVDKICIAGLEAVLRAYLFADPIEKLPVLRQVFCPIEELMERAGKITDKLRGASGEGYAVSVVEDDAAIGGGSFARERLPGVGVAVNCPSGDAAERLAKKMRGASPVLIPRIRGRTLVFNLRTVLPWQDEELVSGIGELLKGA